MGRKRNQGKARKAAKAKARTEEAQERGSNSQMTTTTDEHGTVFNCMPINLSAIPGSKGEKCFHGAYSLPPSELYHPSGSFLFLHAFRGEFEEAIEKRAPLKNCLVDAYSATSEIWAKVWQDSTKLTLTISFLLRMGTNAIIEGNYDEARDAATFVRFLEQHIAIELKRTQALFNWSKTYEMYNADLHTLVKFFRHRIPCSCLDEKYEEVKHITKMGLCHSTQCSAILGRKHERSKTKYCSRCRCATYCSRECQVAHWKRHKPDCDKSAEIIAEFEAEQQNTVRG